ncbi:MAG: glutamine-hydrolyzing carbamoyl-phosphate synthase small subunit [Nitrospinae bacterium]|nr:glutamine-hydrolyzing carbamoyl-phosphate synthase small subunit [Nitrospinota bacterium]
MKHLRKKTGLLLLECGKVFHGDLFGDNSKVGVGEVVFNTSLTGYQEIFTDPSYAGQIVTMTNPLIGNTGINHEDVESKGIFAGGFIVHELSSIASNWRSKKNLDDYLKEAGVIGISELDTRELTAYLRDKGAKVGVIASVDTPKEELEKHIKAYGSLEGKNLAKEVSTKEEYSWNKELFSFDKSEQEKDKVFNVAVYDLGVKESILRNLSSAGCNVTVFPITTPPEKLLPFDGIFISNGPGDPAAVIEMQSSLKEIIGKKPVFGICLGHQILSIFFGAKTYKMKFGHHGGNQPVKNLKRIEIEITAQNHSFAVDNDSLPETLELTHLNLNDNTVEGFRHKELPVFSVQYHPESSPGPHDSAYLFEEFTCLMKAHYEN